MCWQEMSKSQHLLSGNSKMLTFTKGEESTVAGCVSVCQQVLVIMTYLHCLLWLFPKEARGAPLQEGGVAECFRDQELNKKELWNMPGILHIYRVRGVAELFALPQRSGYSNITATCVTLCVCFVTLYKR